MTVMEGVITIPATLIWTVLVGGCGLIGTLSMMLLKSKEKNAEDMLDVNIKAIEAINNNTIALNRIADDRRT